jgi:hypothetical protein
MFYRCDGCGTPVRKNGECIEKDELELLGLDNIDESWKDAELINGFCCFNTIDYVESFYNYDYEGDENGF